MKLSLLSLGLLGLLTPLTAAWSKDDREIFRVRDELAQYEGPEVTFYDFLGVTPAASQDEINKAYRKKSRSLHPDKVKQQLTAEHTKAKKEANKNKNKKPGVTVTKPPSASEVKAAVKAASDRQARLSIVANILRGSGRERYDHFMANGFPVWKGTGYYYNRYRPGLGTVMFGVFLSLGGGAHYLALYMGWKRQRDFVERYIKFARHAAWGDNLGINMPALDAGGGVPVGTAAPPPPPAAEDEARAMPTNRRMRRLQERDNKRDAGQEGSRSGRRGARRLGVRGAATASGSATPTPVEAGPQGAKKRVVAENGKILVVDSLGDVYLEQEDEEGNVELFLLDLNEISKPKIQDTALVRMPAWLFALTVGRVLGHKHTGSDDSDDSDEEDVSDSSSGAGGKHTPSSNSLDDDFELLDKSPDDNDDNNAAAKTTGSQPQPKSGGGKSGKRKGKKR